MNPLVVNTPHHIPLCGIFDECEGSQPHLNHNITSTSTTVWFDTKMALHTNHYDPLPTHKLNSRPRSLR